MNMERLWYAFDICVLSTLMCLTFKGVKAGNLAEVLGSYSSPTGVTANGKFSRPAVLYGQFVKKDQPIWMKSALNTVDHPGLTNWTDSFLKEHYGMEDIKIENTKKEDREGRPSWLTLRQFLAMYKAEDVYMVHSLGGRLADLVLIPETLQCGGFQNLLHEAVMWLGSGRTSSVLHKDEMDNLICLMDGEKDFILIDKIHKHDVESDGFNEKGGYSSVDVDDVNEEAFPRLITVPWREVHLRKGDCLFIPKGWYHQVTSNTVRHFAINVWFSRLYWFDADNCSSTVNMYKPVEPVSTFGFASSNEFLRPKLLEQIHDKGFMTEHNFVDSVQTSTVERRKQFFSAINRFSDSVLSWSELYGFHIDEAVKAFPDIFGLKIAPVIDAKDIVLHDPTPDFWSENFADGSEVKDEAEDVAEVNDDTENEITDSHPTKSTSSSDQPLAPDDISPDGFLDVSHLDAGSLPTPDDPVIGSSSSNTESDDHLHIPKNTFESQKETAKDEL